MLSNFAVVTEIFIDAEGNSVVSSLVYRDLDEGRSAFYNKARYIPVFKDVGYKAVTIIDATGNNLLTPVIRKNEQ